MITFSEIFVGTLLCTVFAFLLWFIVRKKYRRVWFPLLAIFTVPRARMPRLRWHWPPRLAFLCFVLAACASLLFALRPHSMLPMVESKRQLQLYLFIDFSPSLTAYTSIEQYRLFLQNVYTRLRKLGSVTVGTSHRDDMQTFVHAQAFAEHLSTLTFHRAGLQLANVLRQQLPRLADMDRIIIISDRDQHTWGNLHWQHLTIPVHHLVLPQLHNAHDINFFVQQVSIAASPHLTSQRIEVAIAAAGKLNKARDFRLAVYHKQQQLAQTSARLAAGQSRLLLSLTLPRKLKLTKAQLLRLHIDTDDAVLLDNDFYFNLASYVPQATIIADLYGERVLDDPLFQLQTSLEVLGFKIKRRDHAPRFEAHSDLWIVAFGKNFTVQQHCPQLSQKTQVWLLPQAHDFAERAICHCYQRLRGSATPNCRTLAQALNQDKAVQDKFFPLHRRNNLSVFNVPLYAQQQNRLQYASVPVLIQQLLQQQGLGAQQTLQQWLRPADIFSLNATQQQALSDTNVPRGESLLQETQAELPPAVQFEMQGEQLSLPRYRKDAGLWVQALVALALSAAAAEIVGTLLLARRRKREAQA